MENTQQPRYKMPQGYMTKTEAVQYIMEQTGYGRYAVERKMALMEGQQVITLVPNPGRAGAFLITEVDVDKIIAALTPPPAPPRN